MIQAFCNSDCAVLSSTRNDRAVPEAPAWPPCPDPLSQTLGSGGTLEMGLTASVISQTGTLSECRRSQPRPVRPGSPECPEAEWEGAAWGGEGPQGW